jgi:hypothetical protein
MAWNTVAPDGTKSVRENFATIMLDNTTYTKTNLNKDHFWNIGEDEDGHHKYVQMPKFTTPQLATTPSDPTLDTGMDGVYYCKQKSAADSPTQQDVQCFYKNQATTAPPEQIMQIVGARVMGSFEFTRRTNTTPVITPKYYHNVTSITGTGPVGQASLVTITITFPELPSDNYLVFSGSNLDRNFSITTTTTTSLVFSALGASLLNRFYFMIIGG